MSSQVSSALKSLAAYRAQSSRKSQDIVEKGLILLKNKDRLKRGNDDDAWLEQLALAAIDTGRIEVAEECVSTLSEKFPGSPRVAVLNGILKEATSPAESVLAYYDDLLDEDESNAAAWKRKISILRRVGKTDKAVEELTSFLDTYYTDVEGWLELADIYSSLTQYEPALRTLQHVLLLAPQNPFYVLQAAETAYTAGDLPLAARFFLMVIDMTDDPDVGDAQARTEAVPEGVAVRAWFGLKQCTRRFILDPRGTSHSVTQTSIPQHVNLLDELATERLLTAHSSSTKSGPISGREELVKWLEVK